MIWIVLKDLSDSEIERVSIEIARQQNVSVEVLTAVIEEFYEMMMANQYIVQGGISYARQALESAWGKKKAEAVFR